MLLCLCKTSVPLPGSCCLGEKHPTRDKAHSKWTINTPLFFLGTLFLPQERLVFSAEVTTHPTGVRWREGVPLAGPRQPGRTPLSSPHPSLRSTSPKSSRKGDARGCPPRLGHTAVATSASFPTHGSHTAELTAITVGQSRKSRLPKRGQNAWMGNIAQSANVYRWLINELLELGAAPQ